MAASATEMQMKLLLDSNSKKVLFAEVGKDCVDFLFHILSLPLGTVIRLLKKRGMVGCIASLYDSIENLNETYLQNKQAKHVILKPEASNSMVFVRTFSRRGHMFKSSKRIIYYSICRRGFPTLHSSIINKKRKKKKDVNLKLELPVSFGSIPLLSLPDAPNVQKTIYCCGYGCGGYCASDDPGARCNSCGSEMKSPMTYVSPPENEVSEGGIVTGVVTYMVMDNLVVKPMSTMSTIAMLNQFKVKEVGALQEKTVTLTTDKALKLLRLSFKSDAILTNVFLH